MTFLNLFLIYVLLLSSVICYEFDTLKNLEGYCIDDPSCSHVSNSSYIYICECRKNEAYPKKSYYGLQIFCSQSWSIYKKCENYESIKYGVGYNCDYYGFYQDKYFCKRPEKPEKINSNSFNNETRPRYVTNNTYINTVVVKVKEQENVVIANPFFNEYDLNNCVRNGNLNVCNCPTSFKYIYRNLFNNCDNSKLFCNQESKCTDCKEKFSSEYGIGFDCQCSGSKETIYCRNQVVNFFKDASLIITLAFVLLIFISILLCCRWVAFICNFLIKCCKSKAFKCNKRYDRHDGYQMAPTYLSPTTQKVNSKSNQIV
ncbi:unnamed protein product [Brachionus calyciflorus]|uniref:Uncharacterized protein n=1 Tax=Brachionus calyciflorus TaxID=104777 RepID=A0A814HKV2_9BILA|nr:unnamed protein product [Brachionus calyciflorus]